MATLVNFFLPASLPEGSSERRLGYLAIAMALAIMAATIVYSALYVRWGFYSGIAVLWGGAVAFFFVPVLTASGAPPSIGAKLTSVIMLVLISLLMVLDGGVASQAAPWLVVAPLTGLLLAERWFAGLLAGISAVEIISIHALGAAGVVSFPYGVAEGMVGEARAVSYAGFVGVVFVIALIFKGRQEEAMQSANAATEEARAQKEEAEKMAERLEKQKSSVEKQVEEATQELQAQKDALSEHVSQMLEAMSRFADGDLSVRVRTDRDDEIGDLFDGFNQAVGSVQQILSDVKEATRQTASTADQISSSSDQMAASAEEQSAQSEEVAAAVEELNQTIGENAKSVQSVAEAAGEGSRQARNGQEVVSEATAKIKEIAADVQDTAETIGRLQDSSEQISTVVETIDEIAGQTNLLALNAAIEAARAGGDEAGTETGQGFAVVAEEVRELADETDQATSEISSIIGEVQSEIDEAVEAARRSSQNAKDGIDLSEKASETLSEIVSSIERVEQKADEIAAASEEQSTTSEEIAQSVQSISTAAQQSAAGVTQVSDVAGELESVTGKLQRRLQRFTVDEEGRGPGEAETGETAGPAGLGRTGAVSGGRPLGDGAQAA
ncbi:methyl-accepting chemotaxis protein [Salinibacter ruber]|uniref:methyl-accepting chemotaxis protein n=1 Tax=Salinibacter ruber TaxID=146919 RepID=UPI000C9F12DB|nr:methyl-accepting chemotaxis protein [Salinibacter ruber]MCS3612928.1 methyl-accepting chemotaxis protein [Salinibacter ruber]MCS3648194.1 methyl-accepting chemotaxis protein [Salinibacter ruber]